MEQCLNILLTVSTAQKLDHNTWWGFIYFWWQFALSLHIFTISRAQNYQIQVKGDCWWWCIKHPVWEVQVFGTASPAISSLWHAIALFVSYTYLYQEVREKQDSAQVESGVWLAATASSGKSKITCNSVFPSLCRNRSVRSHQVYKG